MEEKIQLRNVELIKIEAEYFEEETHESDGEINIEFKREPTFKLVEKEGDILKIKLIDDLYFEPRSHFEILVEYMGTFVIEEELSEEISHEDIIEIGFPLLMHSISLISNITERFGMMPLVFNPMKGLQEEEEKEV